MVGHGHARDATTGGRTHLRTRDGVAGGYSAAVVRGGVAGEFWAAAGGSCLGQIILIATIIHMSDI